MRQFISISKALSDENRARALMMLIDQELCLCQLIEMLALAPSTVSKHMSILYQAGLVNTRKEGRWMYYSLAGEEASDQAASAIRWTKKALVENKQILADAKNLKTVLKKDKQQLCKHYKYKG